MEVVKKKLRNKGGKTAANIRRKNALKRLEQQYEVFKANGKDKESWTTHGGKKTHAGRKYADECHRLAAEIANLKKHIQ